MGGSGREESIVPTEAVSRGLRGVSKGSKRVKMGQNAKMCQNAQLVKIFQWSQHPLTNPTIGCQPWEGGLRGLFEGSERGFEGLRGSAEG